MSATDATLSPIDLVLVLGSEGLLQHTLAAFHGSAAVAPATLLTPQLVQPVRDLEEIVEVSRGRTERRFFALWHRSDWALVGPPRSSAAADREEKARAFLAYPSPGNDEARIRFFSEHYEWSLHSWYGTYQERTHLFVAADPELARAFSTRAERADRRTKILGHYERVTRPDDFGRFALFYDHGMEGRFAWRLARESDGFPLVLFEFPEASILWWQRAPWAQVVAAQRNPSSRPLVAVDRRLYRITDARLFDAITWRGRGQADLPQLIVPEGTEPAVAFDFLDRLDALGGVRDVGERVGWAQTYVHGGGSEEYHGLFYARDPAITGRFCEIAGDFSESGSVPIHGRT